MILKKVLHIFFFTLFFFETTAQKNTSTITIKTLPGKGTTLYGLSNFNGAKSLSNCLHPLADINGIYKVEFEVNEPILVHLVDYAIAKNNFYFFVEKSHDYVISKHDYNPVHRVKNDSLFINEFNVINDIHSLFSIDRSPELSLDSISSFKKMLKKGIEAQSRDRIKRMFSVEESINLYYAFDKPASTEEQYMSICDSNLYFRNKILDSAFAQKIISKPFYDYFKKYFYLKNIEDVLAIKPLPNSSLNQNTLKKISKANTELEQLFLKDDYINVWGFQFLINEYLHKKLYDDSKYRTISDEIFDYIINTNQFSQKVKDMLLATMLNNDKQITNKVKNYQKQLNKFYQFCKTPLYKTLLEKELSKTNSLITDDVLNNTFLFNEENQSITLKDIINKYKGKYIYIDVWYASYPNSRELLPKALELEKVVKNTDFQVLFFLSQAPQNSWMEEAKRFNISGSNSYYLKNGYESKLAKSLGITYLPRYILIDKQGKLINDDATWPDDILGKKYYED